MGFFVFWMILGAISGAIASSKGRNFWAWFLYGLLLAIVAIPWAIMLKPNREIMDRRAIERRDLKKCEHCAELIRPDAKVCRYCGRDVGLAPSSAAAGIANGQY